MTKARHGTGKGPGGTGGTGDVEDGTDTTHYPNGQVKEPGERVDGTNVGAWIKYGKQDDLKEEKDYGPME